jgi:hypothetical protein
MLIHLSVSEPGENCKRVLLFFLVSGYRCDLIKHSSFLLLLGLSKEFMFDRGFLPMPGW